MTQNIDRKAHTQWNKSEISFQNYQNYIHYKKDIYTLSFIDLLYISNFKWGNATINEPEEIINSKLSSYWKILEEINKEFNWKILWQLHEEEITLLISKISSICDLTHKDRDTKIDGFSVSYLSALLNAYFPNLIPILDRRVLINLNLVGSKNIDKNGQIKNIFNFYAPLIKTFAKLSQNNKLTIRELDKKIFIQQLKIKA